MFLKGVVTVVFNGFEYDRGNGFYFLMVGSKFALILLFKIYTTIILTERSSPNNSLKRVKSLDESKAVHSQYFNNGWR